MLTHKGTVTLTTSRLTLRRLTIADAEEAFSNWLSDVQTAKYVRWELYTDIAQVNEFLTTCESHYLKLDYYQWGIEFNGMLIGTINLHDLSDKSERCELGYCIGSKWWNQGIVSEAARAVINFAFQELNMHKVSALHDVENVGSGCVMQKCGMLQECVLREHTRRRDGTRGGTAFYSILRIEWQPV